MVIAASRGLRFNGHRDSRQRRGRSADLGGSQWLGRQPGNESGTSSHAPQSAETRTQLPSLECQPQRHGPAARRRLPDEGAAEADRAGLGKKGEDGRLPRLQRRATDHLRSEPRPGGGLVTLRQSSQHLAREGGRRRHPRALRRRRTRDPGGERRIPGGLSPRLEWRRPKQRHRIPPDGRTGWPQPGLLGQPGRMEQPRGCRGGDPHAVEDDDRARRFGDPGHRVDARDSCGWPNPPGRTPICSATRTASPGCGASGR